MGLKAGLLEAVGGKLGPCVALYCCWTTVAAEGDQTRRFFSYYLENGFLHGFFFASVYILFLKDNPFLAGAKAEVFFASALTFLALDASAEWSDPVKGFQHRGMIPVLGPRAARRARKHTGGPGFDPRFGPRLFFCPLGVRYPRDPLVRPRSREAPLSTRGSARTLECACGGSSGLKEYTRPPALVCGRKTSARDRIEKYKTLFLSPQSPRSPHLQNHHLPRNPR